MSYHGRMARELGLYVREVRLSLRNNVGAYGFSVMITSTMAMLTTLEATPTPVQILLFLVGGVTSFALIESLATRLFTRSLAEDEDTRVVALGSSFSLVSISSGVAIAGLAAFVLPATPAWLLAPFAASFTYLSVSAIEMSIARRIEEARDVSRS